MNVYTFTIIELQKCFKACSAYFKLFDKNTYLQDVFVKSLIRLLQINNLHKPKVINSLALIILLFLFLFSTGEL